MTAIHLIANDYRIGSTWDELFNNIQRGLVGGTGHEASDDRDAKRLWVPVAGMGSYVVPTSTLVGISVLTDEEIVADVRPACNDIHPIVGLIHSSYIVSKKLKFVAQC